MRERIKAALFNTCPKTGRIVGIKRPAQSPAIWLPVVGLAALIWYAIRVLPKPSRAAYPCQQVAKPLAGSFLVWLFGMTGATVAFRHAGARMKQARYLSAGLAVVVGVVGIGWAALSVSKPAQAAYPVAAVAYTPHPANSPIGVAKGLMPGRVVWTHDPKVTGWNGTTTAAGQRWYDQVDQPRATSLMQTALTGYANTTTTAAAWDAIFRNFNGGAPYQSGEKFFIKVNLTTSNSDGCADSNYNWVITCLGSNGWLDVGNSPQLINALLDQLVNVVGANPADITIGDPTGLWVNELYNKIQPNFPGVVYLDARGTAGSGRTRAARSNVRLYWSAPSNETSGKGADYIQQAIVDAKYVIDLAVLKSHERNGITATAKNHYGSLSGGNSDVRKPTTDGYYNIHLRLPLETQTGSWPQRASMAQYRPLVDLNGHAQMGGKTILYLLDGIYGGRGWAGVSSKWGVMPFCATPSCATADKSWPGSFFLSMDQVAIDSVAFDLLSLRTDWTEVLAAEGVQDYLHEMALADNPPSGAFYDPEGDGTQLASMGVHEHWNNPTEKKYSRNLGTGDGIELLYMPQTALARKTSAPVNIDGAIDAVWSSASSQPFNNVVLGSVSNAADLSGQYRALYDDMNLYLLVEITDDNVMTDWSANWYDDDCIEIMIDGDYSRGTSYDHVNDFELGWRWDDPNITPGVNSAPTPIGVAFKMARTASGWLLETALPLSGIGVPVAFGRLFGLDVHVNDDDTGGARDAKMTWKAQVDDSWQYPYRLGAGQLVGPAPAPLSISEAGAQLLLSWEHQSWNTLYELHRSATPYFAPSQTTIVQDFNPPTDECYDTPPSGPTWFYILRSIDNGLGQNSGYVGNFSYLLQSQ